jgi:hypothetical protein
MLESAARRANPMSDDYDPDDSYSLADVCEKLENIEAAVTANHRDTSWIGWALLIWLAIFVWLPDMWFSKTRFSWWYGVGTDQVTIEKKPADCNFFHAPLGGKGCRYDSQVTATQVKADNSNPAGAVNYVSFDSGKTWTVDDAVPPTKPQVVISWERIEE